MTSKTSRKKKSSSSSSSSSLYSSYSSPPATFSSFTSSTILHQTSPVESTHLMHDSRLPKKLDRTKVSTSTNNNRRKHHHTTTTTSVSAATSTIARGGTTINSKSNSKNNNPINTTTTTSSTPKINSSQHFKRIQSPGDKSRDPSRSLSPSMKSHSSSSVTSTATDTPHTFVYVRDCHYVWLPAQIQSFGDDSYDMDDDVVVNDDDDDVNDVTKPPTTVVTRVVLPDDWMQTTDLHGNSSITELEFNLSSPRGGSLRSSGGMLKGKGRGTTTFGTVPTLSQNRSYNNSTDHHYDGQRRNQNNSSQQQHIYSYEKCHDELNGKIPKGVVRTISLKDYPNGELPLQNIERKKRRGSSRSVTSSTSSTNSNSDFYGGLSQNMRRGSSSFGRPTSNPSPALVNARDMADLAYLHEAAILYNLKLRHAKSLPYTRVGDIVVAVNPFKWINGLYSSEKQALYAQHLVWEIKDIDEGDFGFTNETKNRKKPCKSGEDSADCASLSSNESTVHSLPKDDVDTKHQPMAHGSFYSRLGLEPHVYESASLAYRGLASDQQNQTILVSGESGAGKTETVKIVMSNLATIEQTRPFYHDNSKDEGKVKASITEGMTGIVQQVLESNPLFEAFGCAKTVRNDNSSRFGRFTQLQFEVEDLYDAVMNSRQSVPECLLVGSYCETYLLEKSRVVSHAPGERSYHIFYQLLSASDDEKGKIWDELGNMTNKNFNYISASALTGVEGKLDSDIWGHTKKALKLFGFDGQSFRNLMRALCVVLQLGNISFAPTSDNDDGSEVSSHEELDKLSNLLGITSNDIVKAMTLRVNKIRGEEVVLKSSPTDAKNGCDALAKTIYSRIFDKLVQQINEHTSADVQTRNKMHNIGTISLLDIFGFEKFNVNRFEQLCINYANERLQQRYVLDNFKAVKEEYTAEGIEIFDFRMVDNSPVVNLLERKESIISSLNEECLRPQGSATSLVYKLKSSHKDCKPFLVDRLQRQCEFGIKHFAGAVTYDATDFLKSNIDLTPQDLLTCVCNTSNPFLNSILIDLVVKKDGTQITKTSRNTAKNTVIAKFRSQLNELMAYIEQTSVRYIRCIKPNSDMKPVVLNHRHTMNQLESAGLVTAITISRETFPNRLKYDIIWERFICLYNVDGVLDSSRLFSISHSFSFSEEQLKENVKKMLTSLLTIPFIRVDGARVPSFTCGKTKVYFRTGALEQLESDRMEFYSIRAERIQSWYRCHSARWKYCKLRQSVIKIQTKGRCMICRNQYLFTRLSVIKVQSAFRRHIRRREYLAIIKAVVTIQSWYRCCRARFEYCRILRHAVKIQAKVKAYLTRAKFLKMKYSAITIQALYKGHKDKDVFRKYKASAIFIQALYRGRRDHLSFLQVRTNCLVIQSHVRKWLALRYCLHMRNCIICVQSYARMIGVRNTFIERRKSIITIQSFTRAVLARIHVSRLRTFEKEFARTDLRSQKATVIQTWFRSCLKQTCFKKFKYAVILIQSAQRGRLARDEFKQAIKLIVRAQKYCKGFLARRHYVRIKLIHNSIKFAQLETGSAVRLQRWFIGKQIQRSFIKHRSSAILIQTSGRGIIARHAYQRKRQAAITIQSFARMLTCRLNFLLQIELDDDDDNCVANSNVTDESHPSMRQSNVDRKLNLALNSDITESNVKSVENQLLSLLDSVESDDLDRNLKKEIGDVLSSFRLQLLQIQQENQTLRADRLESDRRNAAITIQSWFRSKFIRSVYLEVKEATVVIQKWYKGVKARQQFQRKRKAAVIIQSFVRMFICRIDFLLQKELMEDDSFHNSNANDESHHTCPEYFTFDGKLKGGSKTLQALPQSSMLQVSEKIRGYQDTYSSESTLLKLKNEVEQLKREKESLLAEKEKLELDVDSLVNYAHLMKSQADMASLNLLELQKSNKTIIDGMRALKLENSKLRRKLLAYEEEGNSDVSVLQRKYQRLLSDRDADITALKNAAANDALSRSREAALVEKKFDKERESYLAEIHQLKNKLNQKKDTNGGYNQKLINVLETSHSSRSEETRKLKKEVKRLKRELDQERSYNGCEKDISLSKHDATSFKKFITTRQNERIQMLLDIVTSVQSFRGNDKQNKRRSFLRKKSEQSTTDSEHTGSFKTQMVQSIEELYQNETEWHDTCMNRLERILTKNTSEVSNQKRRSISPKRKGHGEKNNHQVRMKENRKNE